MRDTGFFTPADKQDRLVAGYVNQNGKLAPFEPWNGLYAKRPNFLGRRLGPRFHRRRLRYICPLHAHRDRAEAAGACSKTETLKAMTGNRLTPEQIRDGEGILGPGRGWGLGVSVQVTGNPYGLQPGAYGWNGGFGTSWFNDPAQGLIAILLTQRVFDSPDPPAVHKTFWRDVYAAMA